jgi:AcrR family transcriptional regulator
LRKSDPESRERTYGGETQDQRKTRRQRQFLDAGLEVFGKAGYRQATVRQLCKEAQLTDRYFYESYAGTEDLLIAVHQDCIRVLRERVQGQALAMVAGNAEQLLRGTLDAFFAGVEDPRVARLVWREVLGVSARVDQVYTASVRNFAGLLLQLGRLIHLELEADNPLHHALAIGLVGAISESAKQWLLDDYREPRAIMVEAGVAIILAASEFLAKHPGFGRPLSAP